MGNNTENKMRQPRIRLGMQWQILVLGIRVTKLRDTAVEATI